MNRHLGILAALIVLTLGFVAVTSYYGSTRSDPVRIELGERAESIRILDDDGKAKFLALPSGKKAIVIWYWSVRCACVRDCEARIRALLDRYEGKDVAFLAIDGNPDDSREDIETLRKKLGSPYEVLRDDDGATVRQFGIKASASVAVLDAKMRLRFRGAIDDDRYKPTVSYVHRAIDAILAGQDFEPKHARPYGCMYPIPVE